MSAEPIFTITYWGATGTLTTPLRPAEVSDKIVQAVRRLVEQGRLADLRPGPGLEEAVRRHVEDGLPFALRSTYGGNTTCAEVQTPDALFVLDCGSGFRELGLALQRRWDAPGYDGPRAAHVLLTHPHMDHTCATPYVLPFFDPRNHFTLWGSPAVLASLEAVLSPASPLSGTYFPPTFDMMKAVKGFRPLRPGQDFAVGSTRIRTHALHHPGGCLAFRLDNAGRAFVFATDHEQPEVPDRGLAAFAAAADLLYTEGQYLRDEYEGRIAVPGDVPLSRRGWGHSPAEACVTTAVAAGVRELHVGHREPRRSDAQVAEIEHYLRGLLREELDRAGRPPDACRLLIPYEGLTVHLGSANNANFPSFLDGPVTGT
jgi:phosphoribosyl 1,2-cyclic phosphodiesterase